MLSKRKDTPIGIIIENSKNLLHTLKTKESENIFYALSNLVLQSECANMIIKSKLIEDLFWKLIPLFKTEKDIMNSWNYLAHLYKFLGSYTFSTEGLNAIVTHNNVFDFTLFLLETISPPTDND